MKSPEELLWEAVNAELEIREGLKLLRKPNATKKQIEKARLNLIDSVNKYAAMFQREKRRER